MLAKQQYLAAAQEVLPQFGVSSTAQLTLLTAAHNVVVRVDDGANRYVLRLQSAARLSPTPRDMQFNWLRSISEHTTVKVPKPIETTTGEYSMNASDNRSWILLRWVEGEPIADAKAFAENRNLEAVGEAVGRLHAHASHYRPANLSEARSYGVDSIVGASSCLHDGSAERLISSSDFASLRSSATKVCHVLSAANSVNGETGLIHADLGPANWVFHYGEPRLIDFDEFGTGPFLFDLLGVLWSHAAWKDYSNYQRSLFRGYARVRPIPEVWLDLSNRIIAARLFGWLNHGCRNLNEADRLEFLKWVPSTTNTIARLCAD